MHSCDQTVLPKDLIFHGQRLRHLRRERGVSVHLLARQAALSARQIWRLEAGDRPNVRAITVARLALALDTSTDYLLGLTDGPAAPHRRSRTNDTTCGKEHRCPNKCN